MIDISLGVVLKIHLIHKINQAEFTGRIQNLDKNEKQSYKKIIKQTIIKKSIKFYYPTVHTG